MKKTSHFFKRAVVILMIILAALVCGCPSGTSDIATYTVTYDGNGATSGTVPADGTSYVEGLSATVLGNTGTLSKTNYSFTGWNTASDGSGSAYTAGSTFTMGASDITLYAIWTKDLLLTITSPSDNGYTNESSFTMDFTFNKDVTGFDAEDISVTNCTLSDFAGSGASYSATIAPSVEGDVVVTVADAVAEDAYGYMNIETSCSLIYDVTVPEQIAGTNSAAGAGKLKITWIEPTTEEDSSFDHEVLKCYENGTYTTMSEVEVNKGICEYTFEGLTTGKYYHVYVFPVDAAGNKQGSTSSKIIELRDETFRNVYYITDTEGFTALSDDLSGYYILMADISLSSTWTPVGTLADPFTGILESFWSGTKVTISGLTTSAQKYN